MYLEKTMKKLGAIIAFVLLTSVTAFAGEATEHTGKVMYDAATKKVWIETNGMKYEVTDPTHLTALQAQNGKNITFHATMNEATHSITKIEKFEPKM